MFARILKANPYHDEKGRFTTEANAVFVSTGPAFSKTIARVKANAAKVAELEKAAQKVTFSDYTKLSGADLSAVSKKLTEATEDSWKSLTKDEIKAVSDYTAGSSSAMNVLAAKTDQKRDGSLGKLIDDLDTALEKFSAPEDMVVMRAMNVARIAGLGSNSNDPQLDIRSLMGKEVIDPSFGSTSISEGQARKFWEDNRVMVRINVRKGKKGAYVSEGRSSIAVEKEFLFPRNTKYKFKSFVRSTNPYNKDSWILEADAYD